MQLLNGQFLIRFYENRQVMDATLLLLGYCYRINDDIESGIIVNPRE